MTPDEKHTVGELSELWTGSVHQYIPEGDNFKITFPMDLAVDFKATLLGAVFLLVSSSLTSLHVILIIKLTLIY